MALPVRISGGNIDGDDNEGHHAQVDKNGNLRVRSGHYEKLNKVYEGEITTEKLHAFNTDKGYNAFDGWITNDGPDTLRVSFTRDGTTYGEAWAMKAGETVTLLHYDIHTLKLTPYGTVSYRVNLI